MTRRGRRAGWAALAAAVPCAVAAFEAPWAGPPAAAEGPPAGLPKLTVVRSGDVDDLCFSADSRQLLATEGRRLLEVTPTGRLRRGRSFGPSSELALSPDGRRLAADRATGPERLALWSARSGRRLRERRIPGYDFETFAGLWAPDSSKVVVPHERGPHAFSVFDGRTLRVVHRTRRGAIPGRHVWTADGRTLMLGHERGAVLLAVGTRRRTAVEVASPGTYSPLALSPDGRRIAGTYARRDVDILDRSTGAQRRVDVGHGDYVVDAAWDPDGRRLAVVVQENGRRLTVLAIDADAASPGPKILGTVRGGDLQPLLTWSPDGRRIAIHARL